MATLPNLDDDDDFGGDFIENPVDRRSGSKRSFEELDDDEDDIFGSKKANSQVEETAPGVATGMILSLRESLEKSKGDLDQCKSELDAAQSEIQKWHSSFQNDSFIPAGTNPEPKMVVTCIQNLRSSEKLLKEQLEKAKKKEAAFVVTFAKREQEVGELKAAIRELRAQLKPPSMQTRKFLLDPAIHEEFTRLKNLVEEKEKKVNELEDNIRAITFTTNSKMGKMLILRCKTLQEENEEIGNQASEGKIKEMSMKLALQKLRNTELMNQFEGVCKNIEAMTSDIERSNEMIVILQEKLEERDAEIHKLKLELQQRDADVVDGDQEMIDSSPIVVKHQPEPSAEAEVEPEPEMEAEDLVQTEQV